MKNRIEEEYVQIDSVGWQPFPEDFSDGGIRWKLLHVSPELGSWTAIFDCPKNSSFASHIHIGPGEYLLTKGKMEVRGGKDDGGSTANALGYGYESCNAGMIKRLKDPLFIAHMFCLIAHHATHFLAWHTLFAGVLHIFGGGHVALSLCPQGK